MTFLPYETFEHEADIGIRGSGRTLEEAFENTARALYSVMVNVGRIVPKEKRIITISAPDVELLLVEWLNALVYEMSTRHMLFSAFVVCIDGPRLRATAWGEPIDRARHEPAVEIKGATYTELRVERIDDGQWIAQLVVDV